MIQFSNIELLEQITPREVMEGETLRYYAHSPLYEGQILYADNPNKTMLWRVTKTNHTKLRHEYVLRRDRSKSITARYLVHLQMESIAEGPERNRLLDKLIVECILPYPNY